MAKTLYLMRATLNGRQCLVPAGHVDENGLLTLPDLGQILKASITVPRRGAPHRRYWAVLSQYLAATHLGDRHPTDDHLHKTVLASLGYLTPLAIPGAAEPAFIVDSTAFNAMDEAEAEAYRRRAYDKLAEWTGVTSEQLEPFHA